MDRVTSKMVENEFKYFLENIGGQQTNKYNEVGTFHLDYNSIYGGYMICEVLNEAGGINNPFGSYRRNKREMFDILAFFNNTIRQLKSLKKNN